MAEFWGRKARITEIDSKEGDSMTRVRIAFSSVLSLLLVSFSSLQAQVSTTAKIDAIVQAPILAGKLAGASIAVVKGKETIVSKGYGLADLELNVPTPPQATYEIGSITKQFTAASILLLAEQGKLFLDDELTKFFPDYPTQGNHITIRRLLNHTSGIKGYTEMPEFREIMMLKKPREELVKQFSAQPFDFKPGDEMIYNNSAFFLLGLIIEKVSGKSYESFVQENLFDRVGMRNSYYCSERTIHKNHVHGYDTDKAGLVLKGYLDHTWPFSAGSLCSSADDLVLWNQALHGGKVLKPESYRQMVAPGVLNDGTKIRYGMGIGLAATDGRRTIGHGGSINGFLSQSDYYPDDDLIVIVLLNTAGPVAPKDIARQIAESVLGKAPERSRSFTGDLSAFAGTYKGSGRGRPTSVRIVVEGNQLRMINSAVANAAGNALNFVGNDTFGFNDTLVTFQKENDKVLKLRLDTGFGYNILTRQP
jgi:CubicO group peptidase (beta-lactamase class C family)